MPGEADGAEIENLVEAVSSLPDCVVRPPSGVPRLGSEFLLPDDFRAFYEICGRAGLFLSQDCAIEIPPPEGVIPSNIAIIGEQYPDDITATWFVIGATPDSEFISIDLSPGRNGRCYDSFHEIHGIVGSDPIIATSFTALFRQLIRAQGEYWYWLQPDFQRLGDAYD